MYSIILHLHRIVRYFFNFNEYVGIQRTFYQTWTKNNNSYIIIHENYINIGNIGINIPIYDIYYIIHIGIGTLLYRINVLFFFL